MVTAKSNGQPVGEEDLASRLRSGVAEVVRKQVESGMDIINDGELSETSLTD